MQGVLAFSASVNALALALALPLGLAFGAGAPGAMGGGGGSALGGVDFGGAAGGALVLPLSPLPSSAGIPFGFACGVAACNDFRTDKAFVSSLS